MFIVPFAWRQMSSSALKNLPYHLHQAHDKRMIMPTSQIKLYKMSLLFGIVAASIQVFGATSKFCSERYSLPMPVKTWIVGKLP